MALDYVSTSKQIIEAVGGAGNIATATHCMTRLRLVLNDESKADDAKVNKIKGVKSVIKQGGQYQVVIGNEVSNLFKEFEKMGNFSESGNAAPAKEEGNIAQRLMGFVAGCMTPLLPAMLGTGMVKVLLTLLTTFGLMSSTGPTYIFLYGMADSFFYFLPILLSGYHQPAGRCHRRRTYGRDLWHEQHIHLWIYPGYCRELHILRSSHPSHDTRYVLGGRLCG